MKAFLILLTTIQGYYEGLLWRIQDNPVAMDQLFDDM